MRALISRLMTAAFVVLVSGTAAHAVETNTRACLDAFGFHDFDDTYPHPGEAAAVAIPAHPTESDFATVCTVDYVYSDEVDITRDGTHLSVIVIDNGFSGPQNPDIVISEAIGRLPAGDCVPDAGVQPWPAGGTPIRSIANRVAFTVAPGIYRASRMAVITNMANVIDTTM